MKQPAVTDDLVQRLRQAAKDIQWEQPLASERERLAADALERLQAEEAKRRAIEEEYHRLSAEVVRLQQALSDAYDTLVHVRTMHQPEWASEQAKAAGKDPWVCLLCGTADGHWPCDTADITDEALAAARALLDTNQETQ